MNRTLRKDEAVRKVLLANEFELDVSMKGVKAGLRNKWFISKKFSPGSLCDAHTCLDVATVASQNFLKA